MGAREKILRNGSAQQAQDSAFRVLREEGEKSAGVPRSGYLGFRFGMNDEPISRVSEGEQVHGVAWRRFDHLS